MQIAAEIRRAPLKPAGKRRVLQEHFKLSFIKKKKLIISPKRRQQITKQAKAQWIGIAGIPTKQEKR